MEFIIDMIGNATNLYNLVNQSHVLPLFLLSHIRHFADS